MTITVGIVDDDPRIRSCLAFYLQHADGIEVAFSTDSALKALEILGNSPVRVLLSDKVMPTMDGMELLNRLRQLDTPPRFLGITAFDNDETMKRLLAAGAAGYILKSAPPAEVIAAVRQAECGGVVLNPELTARFVRNVLPPPLDLTPEEGTLVALVKEGKSNLEIAHELHYALPTIKKKLSKLYRNLGVKGRYELITQR